MLSQESKTRRDVFGRAQIISINFVNASPRAVRQARWSINTAFARYDVTSDGTKFMINSQGEFNNPLTLVANWTAMLGKK